VSNCDKKVNTFGPVTLNVGCLGTKFKSQAVTEQTFYINGGEDIYSYLYPKMDRDFCKASILKTKLYETLPAEGSTGTEFVDEYVKPLPCDKEGSKSCL
jgi:hypothetical protein